MNEYQRDAYLTADPVLLAGYLLERGLQCSMRSDDGHFYISGTFTAAELDTALTGYTGLPTPNQLLDAQIASTGLPFTREQYNTVRSDIQTLRDLRQMGRSTFMALTAAERDRLMYDAFTSVTKVLLPILRDEG